MSAEDDNTTPKTAQGKASEGQSERAADNNIGPAEHGHEPKEPESVNDKKPPGKVDDTADEAGDGEEEIEHEGLWSKISHEPIMLFNLILSCATVMLFIATAVLAVATVGVYVATNHLAHTTGQLVTATNTVGSSTGDLVIATKAVAAATTALDGTTGKLAAATDKLRAATESMAKDSKEQSGDMKTSLTIAKQASDAAVQAANDGSTMVASLQKLSDAATKNLQAILRGNAISQQAQKASLSIGDIDVGNLNEWGAHTSSAHVQIKNTGSVQANNVRIATRMIVARPSYEPCKSTHLNLDPTAPISPNGGFVTVDAPASRAISADQIANINAGKFAVFVWGRVTFSDPSNRFRYKDFCMSYSGQIPQGSLPFTIADHCNGGN